MKLPAMILRTLQKNGIELLLVLCCFVYMYARMRQHETVITSDGKGYYNYLPALFIYDDLNFNYIDTLKTDLYTHNVDTAGVFNRENGFRFNKYLAGTAICQLPAFIAGHTYAKLFRPEKADGYSYIYQNAMWAGAWFYLLAGLILLRNWLKLCRFSTGAILFAQLTLLFTTPLLFYTNYDSAYSHIYSFGIVLAFLYCFTLFIQSGRQKHLVIAALLFGLIALIRPTNGVVIFGIFLYFRDFKTAKTWMIGCFHWKKSLTFSGCFLLIFSIQPLIYFYTTGSWWIDSYRGEPFFFFEPQLMNWLFSIRKGVFFWSPFLGLIFLLALLMLAFRKQAFNITVLIVAFGLVAWVSSAWWCWWYGATFGQRVIVEHLYLFAWMAALTWTVIPKNWLRIVLGCIMLVAGYLNIFQMKQHERFILKWDRMTWNDYRIVFMKADQKYVGLLEYLDMPVPKENQKHVFFEQTLSAAQADSINHQKLVTILATDVPLQGDKIEVEMTADFKTGNPSLTIVYLDSLQKELHVDYASSLRFTQGKTGMIHSSLIFPLPEYRSQVRSVRLLINKEGEAFRVKQIKIRIFDLQSY